jgi:hypothetical protein
MQAKDYNPALHYRTSDMGLVAVLKLNGHGVIATYWERSSANWLFPLSDNLFRVIDEFSEGGARVEPKAYNRAFKATKDEFYALKDSQPTFTR